MKKRSAVARCFAIPTLLTALCLVVAPAYADQMALTSLNSTVQIDPNTQAGVYNWIVDGVDLMYQQWFWFRVNSDTQEHPLDGSYLRLASQTASGGRGTVNYTGSGYSISVRFSLF